MSAGRTPFAANAFIPDSRAPCPVSRYDQVQTLDGTKYYRQCRRAAGGAPPPPRDCFAPTASRPSSGRSKIAQQHDDFPVEVQPLASRGLGKSDKITTGDFEDEVAHSTTYPRRNKKRSIRDERQVLQRDEPSGLEQDAQEAADLLNDRVEYVAKRVASMCHAVAMFRDALEKSKAKQTLAMGQAVTLEEAATAASSAVKLARNEASAAKLRLENSSRPRRFLNYFKAKWDNEPRPLDVDEAERRLDEAVRVLTSANKEVELAWDVVRKNFNQVEALASKLRRAQYAQASAQTILVDLKAELTRAKHQVVRTAREVHLGRCLAREVYVPGVGGRMGSLLVAARTAARSEDDFSGDEHLQQVAAQKTKRARH